VQIEHAVGPSEFVAVTAELGLSTRDAGSKLSWALWQP